MAVQYLRDTGTLGWTAVTAWSAVAVIAAGALRRQTAPAVAAERVFVAIVAGVTLATQPTWVLTKGAKTTDDTVTWQECTGQPGINGDLTNQPAWASIVSSAVALGVIVKDAGSTVLYICTTAGTAGAAEPTWNTTAGMTTADNTVTWTSIGAVGTFGAWAAPHAKIDRAAAATWHTSGDTVYVASDHAETRTVGLNMPAIGSASSISRFISVSSATVPPAAMTAGARVLTTTNGAMNMSAGVTYVAYHGIEFSAGSGGSSASIAFGSSGSPSSTYLDSCTFNLPNTGSASRVFLGGGSNATTGKMRISNCAFIFGSASHRINAGESDCEIINSTFAATGTVPAVLFEASTASTTHKHTIVACDLSNIPGTLFTVSAVAASVFLVRNCRLNAAVTISTGAIAGQASATVIVENADSAATSHRVYFQGYAGTVQQSTSTFLTGQTYDGTTPLSLLFTSTANASVSAPLTFDEIIIPVYPAGAKTVTAQLTSAATLTNNDVWIEIEYLAGASFPQSTILRTRPSNILAAGTALTTSAAAWTAAAANRYVITQAVTSAMAGPVKIRLYLARVSTTVYFDFPSIA